MVRKRKSERKIKSNIVDKFTKNPDQFTNAGIFAGYLGKSDVSKNIRLYLNLKFNHFIEIPKNQILHQETAPSNILPFGGVVIWVKKGIKIKYVKIISGEILSELLSGDISKIYENILDRIYGSHEEKDVGFTPACPTAGCTPGCPGGVTDGCTPGCPGGVTDGCTPGCPTGADCTPDCPGGATDGCTPGCDTSGCPSGICTDSDCDPNDPKATDDIGCTNENFCGRETDIDNCTSFKNCETSEDIGKCSGTNNQCPEEPKDPEPGGPNDPKPDEPKE